MKSGKLHRWDVDRAAAVEIQLRLKEKTVIGGALKKPPRLIAGADISYNKTDDLFFAGVVVLDARTLDAVEEASFIERAVFPYIPGLLSFREAPVLLKAFEKIKSKPDVIMFDGQGIAHPRRIGLACHMGLFLDVPSLGCAKKKLVGDFEEPRPERGSFTWLRHRGETVGAVLRTRDKVKPVFVSPGHKIGLEASVEIALACCRGYRIPEPTRQAHLLVNKIRQENNKQAKG